MSSTKATSSPPLAQEGLDKKESISEDSAEQATADKTSSEDSAVKTETKEIREQSVKKEAKELNKTQDVYDADPDQKTKVVAASKPQSPMKKKLDLHKKHNSDLSEVVKSAKSVAVNGTSDKSKPDMKPKEKPDIFTEFSKKAMEEKKALWVK